MTIRTLTVERRIVGTINQLPNYACHYKVAPDTDTAPRTADFMVALAVAAANGSPTAHTFQDVSEAVRAHGRTLAGTDGSHDEHTEFTGSGPNYNVMFRDIPPVGDPPEPKRYTLQDVKDDPGAPAEADFDAVIAALIAYGDSVAT